MLCVTMNDIPGWEIQRVCGEVFGVTVRSRNAFSQIGAGFKSMVGGELGGMTKNVIDSRNEAMTRLFAEAQARGGNALVAMRFDTTELGNNWSEICAYGTAVVAVPVTEAARQTAIQLGYGQPSAAQQQPAQGWGGQPNAQGWQGGPGQHASQPGIPSQHGVPGQPGVPSQHGVPSQPGVPGQPGVPSQPGVPAQQQWSQPTTQQPATHQPATQQPATQQPPTQQPAMPHPADQQPVDQQPTAYHPTTQYPPAE